MQVRPGLTWFVRLVCCRYAAVSRPRPALGEGVQQPAAPGYGGYADARVAALSVSEHGHGVEGGGRREERQQKHLQQHGAGEGGGAGRASRDVARRHQRGVI